MMIRNASIASNEPYHLYNRGNDRNTLFHEQSDYVAFIERLDEQASKHAVAVLAFVLMPNHYHLLAVQHPGGSIPLMMEGLGTSVARRYNLKYSHTGHVFQGPYRHALVTTTDAMLQVARYIHLNPVRARLAETVGEWPYSSYHLLMSSHRQGLSPAREPGFHLASHDPRALLAALKGDADAYRRYVAEEIAGENALRALLPVG